MEAKRFNRSFDKNDLQALLSELQSFPLLQKLVEADGVHLHIHFIVNNGYNYGCMIGGNNEGSLTNQHNERGNNIQGNDNKINSVNVSGNDNSTNSVSGNDNSINSNKLNGVN